MKLAQINFEIDFTNLQAGIGGRFGPGATIGDIINAAVPYLFTFAGLLLLIYLLFGGFEFMTSAGDPKKAEAAKAKLTYALIGFIIVFTAFWLTQIMALILGLDPIIDVFG